jgi:hypothetical protein
MEPSVRKTVELIVGSPSAPRNAGVVTPPRPIAPGTVGVPASLGVGAAPSDPVAAPLVLGR